MENKLNQDIIDFRYKLINAAISNTYNVTGIVCNDNYTNIMTVERQKVLTDVLVMFNIFFSEKGYEIG